MNALFMYGSFFFSAIIKSTSDDIELAIWWMAVAAPMPPTFKNLIEAHAWFIRQRPFIPRLARFPGPKGNLLIYELAHNAWPGRSPEDPKFQEASYAQE